MICAHCGHPAMAIQPSPPAIEQARKPEQIGMTL